MKKVNTKNKLSVRMIINIAIFAIVTILFAVLPKFFFANWFPNDESQPPYSGYNFSYILNDVCPCTANDDSCSGYFACGPDKANITYNLDNAPEDKLQSAKRDSYFENLIESSRQSANVMRLYLLCDICYLLSFISLVSGIIYWNHCKAISKIIS